jgi:hypothetical protein
MDFFSDFCCPGDKVKVYKKFGSSFVKTRWLVAEIDLFQEILMPYDRATLKTYRNKIIVLIAPCLAKISQVFYF